MYELVERTLNEDERRRLLACLPPGRPVGDWRRKLKLDIIAQVGGFGIGTIVGIWVQDAPVWLVIPIVLGCWALYWLFKFKGLVLTPLRKEREAKREANDRLAKFQTAVNAAKTVRVQRVEGNGVVQVFHDEGTIYLFDLGDNRTFWIDPYCDMMPGPDKNWPNSKFEVVKLRGWKEELGPFCYGKRLEPRETLEFADYFEEYDFDKLPSDGLINESADVFLREARTQNLAYLAAKGRGGQSQ